MSEAHETDLRLGFVGGLWFCNGAVKGSRRSDFWSSRVKRGSSKSIIPRRWSFSEFFCSN